MADIEKLDFKYQIEESVDAYDPAWRQQRAVFGLKRLRRDWAEKAFPKEEEIYYIGDEIEDIYTEQRLRGKVRYGDYVNMEYEGREIGVIADLGGVAVVGIVNQTVFKWPEGRLPGKWNYLESLVIKRNEAVSGEIYGSYSRQGLFATHQTLPPAAKRATSYDLAHSYGVLMGACAEHIAKYQ